MNCHFFKYVKEIPESQIFIDFFEHLMIRTCSEAIAESVGSIMSLAMKRGRNTHPVNFEKRDKTKIQFAPSSHIK